MKIQGELKCNSALLLLCPVNQSLVIDISRHPGRLLKGKGRGKNVHANEVSTVIPNAVADIKYWQWKVLKERDIFAKM